MIRVSRVTKRSKASKRIREINGKNRGMGDCRHTALRPAITGVKDIKKLEEVGMADVLRMRVWLVVGQVCVSQA